MDWLQIIVGPDNGDATLLQYCARAVLLFLYGVLCIRIAGRRTFSHLSPLDIVVAIVVGSNISRAMTGKAPFVASLVATLLLVLLHRLVAIATIRSNWLASFVKGKPAILVRDGVPDHAAMRRYHISDDDLIESLRMEQICRVEDAALATFERGGKITVIPARRS